jgi:translation initiation factor IF-1
LGKDDFIEVDGEVLQALPNALFKVKLENGQEILAHLGGRLRKNFIVVCVHDKVRIHVSPYDLTKGRIVFRNK